MKVVRTKLELNQAISALKKANSKHKIGFVPTMGALHKGHLVLVKEAEEHADIVVVSIFVNPTQFNNLADLEKYPRTLDADIELLKTTSCSILFAPTKEVVYPPNFKPIKINLNQLDEVMEGEFRPGHFEGVVTVVHRLFELVCPDYAFFGKKDFQQLAIIQHLVKTTSYPVQIKAVEIQRNNQGLALSSRNARLSEQEKIDALVIYQTLTLGKKLVEQGKNIQEIKSTLRDFFNQGRLKLEYLAIVDNTSLNEVEEVQGNMTCCIAAYCGQVRLIDNMALM